LKKSGSERQNIDLNSIWDIWVLNIFDILGYDSEGLGSYGEVQLLFQIFEVIPRKFAFVGLMGPEKKIRG